MEQLLSQHYKIFLCFLLGCVIVDGMIYILRGKLNYLFSFKYRKLF